MAATAPDSITWRSATRLQARISAGRTGTRSEQSPRVSRFGKLRGPAETTRWRCSVKTRGPYLWHGGSSRQTRTGRRGPRNPPGTDTWRQWRTNAREQRREHEGLTIHRPASGSLIWNHRQQVQLTVSEDADQLSGRIKRSPERTRRARRTRTWARDRLARPRSATTLSKLPPCLSPGLHHSPRPAARDAKTGETRRSSGLIINTVMSGSFNRIDDS